MDAYIPATFTTTSLLQGRVARDILSSEMEARSLRQPPHLSFDVRPQDITSDEDDGDAQAAWEADREEYLFGIYIERAS